MPASLAASAFELVAFDPRRAPKWPTRVIRRIGIRREMADASPPLLTRVRSLGDQELLELEDELGLPRDRRGLQRMARDYPDIDGRQSNKCLLSALGKKLYATGLSASEDKTARGLAKAKVLGTRTRMKANLVDGHNCSQWRTQLKDLVRENVGQHTAKLPDRGVEVDRVFECQALGEALRRTTPLRDRFKQMDWSSRQLRRQPIVVQNALSHARDVHNRLPFLAATDKLSNDKKQGAFQVLLNRFAVGDATERSLETELAAKFAAGKDPFESEQAEAMAQMVVAQLRGIEDGYTEALRDVHEQDKAARSGTGDGGDGGGMVGGVRSRTVSERAQLERWYGDDGLAGEVVQIFDQLGLH